MADILYTQGALEDLDGIWHYSVNIWGEAQAADYIEKIEDCCIKAVSGDAASRNFHNLKHVHYIRCEHHYIFWTIHAEKPVIIAIFHEKMDIIARLSNRLK